MENKYLKRIADRVLQERLAASGAVLIEGPNGAAKQGQHWKIQKAICLCKTRIKRFLI